MWYGRMEYGVVWRGGVGWEVQGCGMVCFGGVGWECNRVGWGVVVVGPEKNRQN